MFRLLFTVLSFFLLTVFNSGVSLAETAYDRVMKTQTIRCGYATANPWIYKDVNSGEMQGFIVDIVEEMGNILSLKIEWAEETGWGNLAAAVNSGRIDMGCAPLWMDPERGKVLAFSRPIFFSPIHAYKRTGDERFTGKLEELDQPDIKLAVQESNVSLELANRLFKNSGRTSLSSLIGGEEIAFNVLTGKADIFFAEHSLVKRFNAAQGDKIERVPFDNPLRVYGVGFPFDIHETAMQNMINTALLDMISSGRLEDLLVDYAKNYSESYIPISKPYNFGQ